MDQSEEKKYRGRIFDVAGGKEGKGAYITVSAQTASDVMRMLSHMYRNRESKGRDYQPICYIDKKDDEGYTQIMRYDAENQKDVSKVYLQIPGEGEIYFGNVAWVKETQQAKYDSKETKWYVTKDVDFKALDDIIKQYLPDEYKHDYQAVGYSKTDKMIVYGDTIEEVLQHFGTHNVEKEEDKQINRAYVKKMNWDTKRYDEAMKYQVDGHSGATLVENKDKNLSKETSKENESKDSSAKQEKKTPKKSNKSKQER